ncbi:MAG: hypothetical protein ACOX6J_07300 [Oscillospiraceae bacterium]|jgi:hypothetical protein
MMTKIAEHAEKFLAGIMDSISSAESEIDVRFSEDELRMSGKVYIAGNGSAYAAAYALKNAFRTFTDWTGNWIYPMTEAGFAFEAPESDLRFGRNFVVFLRTPDSDKDISAAAEKKANEFDSETIALSSESSCACVQYMELYLKGLILAAKVGHAQGHITDSEYRDVLQEIVAYADKLKGKIPEYEGQADEAAGEVPSKVRNYETIGTEMDYGAARLLRDVLYRKTGKVTTVEESEDYLHVNALNVEGDQFATFIVNSKDNPAYSRTLLTINNVDLINRFVVIASDGPKSDLRNQDLCFFETVDSTLYPVKGLGSFLPLAIFAEKLGK